MAVHQLKPKRRQGQRVEREETAADRFIDHLGGTSAVATITGIRPASVSNWRLCGIPPEWLDFFSRTNPSAVAEFPDAFRPADSTASARSKARSVSKPDPVALATLLRDSIPAIRASGAHAAAANVAAVAAALMGGAAAAMLAAEG